MKTVAIIGGGFSGTMTAVNLARLSDSPLKILLINSRSPTGRGVAYGTTRGEHVLNVAARNMSAVPDHPNHFLDWLRTRVDYSDIPDTQLREMFVPRRAYGDYLCGLLQNYLDPIDDHHPATIDCIEDEAVDIAIQDDGRAEVMLKGGDSHTADRVLLATGNQPPAAIGDNFTHAAYCADPWTDWQSRLPGDNETIITLGTGLTMVDVFLTLKKLGWKGQLVAISRNGMIPQAQFRGIEYPDFLPEHPEDLGLAKLETLLTEHCEQLRRLGENPGIIVDRLRSHAQRIWQHFSCEEKQEFLSRIAPRWNVIRHRIAQPIHQDLTEAITGGSVRIVTGSITNLIEQGDNVGVTYTNSAGQEQTLTGGLVINCTGPQSRFSTTDVPLFQNLLSRGLIHVDEMDMGIDVAPDFAVTNAEGQKSELLFAIGPLIKGTLWETTAVPELRGQAFRVAKLLLTDVTPTEPDHDYRFSVPEEHVIEYYI